LFAARRARVKAICGPTVLEATVYAGHMNHTPDQNGSERPRKGPWRRLSARAWVELAIYVFFGLIVLLAGIGWLLART
jgi:hypothetical protein